MPRRDHSQSGSTDRRAKSKEVQQKLTKQRGKNTDGSKKADRSGKKGGKKDSGVSQDDLNTAGD
jgi:hypothetical protein